MKLPYFIAGLLLGLALSAVAATMLTIDITHHDALGRTQHATAHLNSVAYINTMLVIDYTSDSLGCSGFEPTP